jgi:hypothetical protein
MLLLVSPGESFVPASFRPTVLRTQTSSPPGLRVAEVESFERPFKEREFQVLTDILPMFPEVEEGQLKDDANYMKMALEVALSEYVLVLEFFLVPRGPRLSAVLCHCV